MVCKLEEKTARKQMDKYLKKRDNLDVKQHGFQRQVLY